MTTNSKLIESILAAGREQAAKIEKDAAQEAERILAAGREQAEAAKQEILDDADRTADGMRHAAKSSATLLERNAVLQTKRNEIEKTLNGIGDYIAAMDDDAYFAFIYRLAASVKGESGEILLNSRDKSRLPADFVQRMNGAGLTCTLSEGTADIPGGFIIKDGDIETSLAVDALIEEKRNALEDFVNSYLFAKEE